MNLYDFHTNPEQLEGYENRLRVPMFAYEYGRRHGFTDELVSAVAKHPKSAFEYAWEIIEGRFPEGEAVIATDPQYAYWYAKNVIKDRWPEAEPVIAKDPDWARAYQEQFGIKL